MMRTIHTRGAMLVMILGGALAVSSGCQSADSAAGERGELRPDQPIQAALFRYQQRLSEDGAIPDNALMRAKRQRDRLLERAGLGGGVTPASWTWVGPGNIGGRIRPVVIHPNDPQTIWVGSASGGIWKTTDAGQSWAPLDDFMASLSVSDLVLHPEDPNTLYAATGEGFFEIDPGTSNTAAVRGAGIFVSNDGGVTWNQMPSTATSDFHFVNRLVIHPTDPQIILAATGTGIWRTTDGGEAWSQRSNFDALDIKMNPDDPTKLVAGGHHADNGPFYSTDGGVTWQQAAGAGGHRQELAYAPSDPSIVYASVSLDDNRLKIWRSTDGGQTYAERTSGGGIQTWASYNNTIWVDPTNPDFLIVGGVWLFRSVDGGVSLQQRFGAVHADMHRIVQHPAFDGADNRTVFFATDGGIYRTDDVYGSDAFDLNNNLGITQFYGAAINPDTGHIAGGTQDNGSLSFHGDPQDWTHYFGGDGGYGAADPTDPDYFYGEVQRARIHRSTNGGHSASFIYFGIDDANSLRTNFIPFFMLDPNDPNRMIVCCRQLWRSDNVKSQSPDWTSIKPDIDDPGPIQPGHLSDIRAHFAPNDPRNISTADIAEGNSDLIWVGHNNGQIWVTTNGTDATPTWNRVDQNGGDVLPDRWISTIVINPDDHDEVYVAFMGWEPDNVWKTTDAGQTWTPITGSGGDALPAAPASALAVHRNRPGWLYVGTDIGVFTSNNDGLTWTTSTDGPGTVPVEQLLWKNDNTLMAVTHGRGVFLADIVLPASLVGLDVVTGQVLEGDATSLELADGDELHTRSGFGRTLSELHKLELIVHATSAVDSPSSLDVLIESRIDEPAGTASVALYNWTTDSFDTVGTFSVGDADTAELIENINPTDYVNTSGGGEIDLRLKHIVFAPFLAFTFDSFIDHVEISVR